VFGGRKWGRRRGREGRKTADLNFFRAKIENAKNRFKSLWLTCLREKRPPKKANGRRRSKSCAKFGKNSRNLRNFGRRKR